MWLPLLWSLGVLALTLLGVRYLEQSASLQEGIRFRRSIDAMQRTIESRLDTYTSMVRGVAGLFVASELVTSNDFLRYASQLQLHDKYPGIQALGFARKTSPVDHAAFAAGLDNAGIGSLQVFPPADGEQEQFPIVLAYPRDERNRVALGYDMYSDATRRSAMRRAIDTAEPALSEKVTLIQEITATKQHGFLIYLPIYSGGDIPERLEERRAKIEGFAYGAFRANDLFEAMLGKTDGAPVGVQIYDGLRMDSESLLFASDQTANQSADGSQGLLPVEIDRERATGGPSAASWIRTPRLRELRQLEIAGHHWQLSYYSRYAFEKEARDSSALWLLVCGTALSGVLGAAVFQRIRYFEHLLRNEVELEKSEQRYRNFIQQSSEAIWRAELAQPIPTSWPVADQVDAFLKKGRVAECNDTMARMHGFKNAEELLGRPVQEVLRPTEENVRLLCSFFRSGYRLGKAHSEELEQNAPARTFVNSLVGTVENGLLVETWGTKQDVTDIEIAQESIRLHTRILDSLVEGVSVASADGTIIYSNPAQDRLFGFEPGELAGRNIANLYGEAAVPADRLLSRVADHIRENSQRPERFLCQRKDGSSFMVAARFAALELRGRSFIVCVQEDITDQLHHEESRREMELERSRMLHAERAAREEAERASRMKDEFLATLSHELRTPLNAILGWAQLTKRQPSGSDQISTGLDIIERNARTQSQIIDDLLDMNRIISGKVRLNIISIDPVRVVHDAIETVRPAAEAKALQLDFEQRGDIGLVRADPNRLHQVFWNLLSNAVKFTDRHGKVVVRLARNENQVEVTVSDTGIGINTEFLPFVFDRFRQGDASTTRRHGGLGLGLAIVRHLVELHGGHITAESCGLGTGASFSVTLPVAPVVPLQEETDSFEPQPHDDVVASASPSSLKGAKILVVDDQPDARDLVKRLLEEVGATVLTASSAQEGLETIAKEPPSVIVSDIGMPEVDGYEFLRQVRKLPPKGGGATPAIALTAFARAEDRLLALRAGYQSHLSKPVEPSELIQVIAAVVHG